MSTNVVSSKQIKREWHLIDAKDQILGRLATEVANKLMGKQKSEYVPYLDMGDFVVVTNAQKIKVSGKKEQQKKYYHHSMYPGGLKVESYFEKFAKKPEDVIRHAVSGMLPKNKLKTSLLKKLHIYKDNKHPYEKQLGGQSNG